ncbi:MAG: nitroreductase family protein [Candidatus Wallbacteria bacterium]|nr:nitroreductase family protein [Candidatus Wallbacteria bacterium]
MLSLIRSRRSVRAYTDRVPTDAVINSLLACAFNAPSAGNEQPWHFIVIKDRSVLTKIPEFHPYSAMLKTSHCAILVCGDMNLQKFPGNWTLDCSNATMNILLAAHAIGLGAVWLGVHPEKDREEGMRKLLSIPEGVVPFALVVLGYPAKLPESRERKPMEERIHRNAW